MAAVLLRYSCSDCGTPHSGPASKCTKCGHWFSVNAHAVSPRVAAGEQISTMKSGIAKPAELVHAKSTTKYSTGLPQLDHALEGGVVPDIMTVFSGAPGSGKSRFVRQLAAVFARRLGRRALLISAEEMNEQVRASLDKQGLDPWLFDLAYSNDLAEFEGEIFDKRPSFFVFDSLNYLTDSRVEGGKMTKRLAAFTSMRDKLAQRKITSFVIAHINSEDNIAEDKNFERLPDAHFFLGEPMGPTSTMREIEVRKGRFYPPAKCPLTMTARGLV